MSQPPDQPEQPWQPPEQQPGPPLGQPGQQPEYQQPVYGQPGYQQPPYQPGQQPMYPAVPPNSSKATTSLILGIISLVACGLLLGIPAMIVGRQAKREIRESGGRLGGEGMATAGFVTGLIGTVWSVLAGIALVILLILGAVFANNVSKNCHTVTDQNGNTSLDCSNL